MPSVEMRRSTRVFVPKAKDGELVRVLRSGRRLWVESGEVKNRGPNNGDEWYPLIENNTHCKDRNGWRLDSMDIDDDDQEENQVPQKSFNSVRSSQFSFSRGERMVKNVYSRKRTRKVSQFSAVQSERREREFILYYVRRQRRRKIEGSEEEKVNRGLLPIVVDSSCGECSLFSRLLCCVLRQMSREEIGLNELSSFLISSPISPVFASAGIHFLLDRPSGKRKSLCRIFGARKFAPLFSVDFSAAPLCFLQLHKTMLLRSVHLSYLCWIDFHEKSKSPNINDALPDIKEQIDQCISIISAASNKDDPKIMEAVNPSVGAGKLGSWNTQCRIGVTTRGNGMKRRRRSLRTRRARNPSHLVLKAIGSLVSNHIAPNKKASLSSLCSTQELRRSARKGFSGENHVPKSSSSSMGLNVNVESQCCSANILVIEHDKGYRIEGAEVMLDVSDSNDWILAVKKEGSMQYHLKVQREMRLGNFNRFTHSIIWAAENGWKLEFPERKDWLLFKELYKACVERNVVPTSPDVKMIPVPGVREVSSSWESSDAFKRLGSYIRITGDELSRALSRRKAYYDMDCEDEEWLKKFNNELEGADIISEETFELIIDVFEKASYRNPDEFDDEKKAANLCLHYASSLVAEEVYKYWIKKRNQKRAPLIRVFQLNQPSRAQFITKPVLRKKRSLKRNTMQLTECGRGKESTVLQGVRLPHQTAHTPRSSGMGSYSGSAKWHRRGNRD